MATIVAGGLTTTAVTAAQTNRCGRLDHYSRNRRSDHSHKYAREHHELQSRYRIGIFDHVQRHGIKHGRSIHPARRRGQVRGPHPEYRLSLPRRRDRHTVGRWPHVHRL